MTTSNIMTTNIMTTNKEDSKMNKENLEEHSFRYNWYTIDEIIKAFEKDLSNNGTWTIDSYWEWLDIEKVNSLNVMIKKIIRTLRRLYFLKREHERKEAYDFLNNELTFACMIFNKYKTRGDLISSKLKCLENLLTDLKKMTPERRILEKERVLNLFLFMDNCKNHFISATVYKPFKSGLHAVPFGRIQNKELNQ